jgi:hypothetical protein
MAAVLPQFEPAGQAMQAPSWMQRSQMKLAQADEEQRRQQFEILKPVLQAKATADMASSVSQLADARLNEQHRAQYAVNGVQAKSDLNDILVGATMPAQEEVDTSTMTPQEVTDYKRSQNDNYLAHKEQDLESWMAKNAYLQNIPEGKQLFDQADKARADSFKMRMASVSTEAMLDRIQMQSTSKESITAMQQENANLRAQIAAQTKVETTGTTEQGKNDREDIRLKARADQDRLKADLQAGLPAAKVENLQQKIAEAHANAADAVARNANDEAQIYLDHEKALRDELTKQSTFAGQAPSKPGKVGNVKPKLKPAQAPAGPSASVHVDTTAAADTPASAEPVGLEYKAPIEVVQAVKSGKISRDEATKILKEKFGLQ